jgi:hypothetical protein
VTVVADGVSTECAVEFPLSCNAGEPCEPGSEIGLGLNGCALAPAEQTISGVYWSSAAPAKVEISVAHEGEGLGDATFTPTYQTGRPNGPECEPECTQAEGTLLMKLR